MVTQVSWQNLLKHSTYFQSISKPCFSDIKSNFVKVNIPANLKTFLNAMQFMKTSKGDVQLKSKLSLYRKVWTAMQRFIDDHNISRKNTRVMVCLLLLTDT